MSFPVALALGRRVGRVSFVAAALLAAASVRAQLGQNAPQVVTSLAELRDRADAAWTESAAVAMYPPGMSFTNALPVFAVAAGFDPAFLAGLREAQTTEGIVLRSGMVRETTGATPQRQWFGAGAMALAATPLPQGYDPVAWVLARFPPPAFLSGPTLESYIAERRLSRQTMTFTLIAEADVPAYLAARAARIAAMPAGQFGEDDLGMSGSAYDPVAKALRVLLVAPSYAGMLGVFETRDLRNPHPWALLATLPNTGGVVEFVVPDPPAQGVFRLANLLTDSDLDGIPDAVEDLVLGTNAHAWDSAGDGISDWDHMFRLGGADTAGGVPAQVAYGLGLPGQDMSKVVSGPVELLRKAWRTERDKNGWTGFLDTRTRFLGLEYHQEYGPITWNTRYYGNTESSRLRYEKNDRQYVGGVLQDVVGTGELTPADSEWHSWSYANIAPPPLEYILSNTWSGAGAWSVGWHRRLCLPYTDPRLATLAAQDINALRSAGLPVPGWGQLLLRMRPAEWSETGGTDELGNALIVFDEQGTVIPNIPGDLLGPTLQPIPDARGALEQSAFRVPKILEKPGEPDLLGGLELQAISWQAATVQHIPAGHLQRGVVLEAHRDPAPEGVYEGVVTRVVPREVFLKPTATGGESVVFTLPPPQEAGSVEVVDGYAKIERLARQNEALGCSQYRLTGQPVQFRITGLSELARFRAHRVAARSPAGAYPLFRLVGSEVWSSYYLGITAADLDADGAVEVEVLPDVPGDYTVVLEAVGGARNGSGEWESAGPGVEVSSASFLALRFRYLPESTENFAPSAGEMARFTVAVEPPPPPGGYGGLYVNVYVERRLNGGARQHIQHLDADGGDTPGVVAFNAALDFAQRRFTWDGCPVEMRDAQDPDPTVIASRAEGPETFGGLDPGNPVRRVFPVMNIGECVPPSTYHVVVRIMEGTGDLRLFHSESWTVGVAQVVLVTMTGEARQALLQPQVLDNGTVVAQAVPEGMVDGLCEAIVDSCNNTYSGVNIRFRTEECLAPYATVNIKIDPLDAALGRADSDWLNTHPGGDGHVNLSGIKSAIAQWYFYRSNPPAALPEVDWRSFPIPISPEQRQSILSHVAAHEAGHLLGLVNPGLTLGGSAQWHNPGPWARRKLMNPGAQNDVATGTDFIGANGPWTIRSVNYDYLQFILPIEHNEENAP